MTAATSSPSAWRIGDPVSATSTDGSPSITDWSTGRTVDRLEVESAQMVDVW